MLNWIKNRKSRREAELKELMEKLDEDEKDARAEVERGIREMTSKRCPINGGMCIRSCVHFFAGRVYSKPYIEHSVEWISVAPHCKLWP